MVEQLSRIKAVLDGTIGPELTGALSWLYWSVVPPIVAPYHWLWILTAVAVAFLFFLAGGRSKASSPSFVSFLVPRSVFLHRSALLDYRYYVVNQLAMAQLRLGALVVAVAGFFYTADAAKLLLGALLGPAHSGSTPTSSVLVLFTLCTFLAHDFGRFLAHYLQHKIPLLWEFHKTHHSAEVLTPVTGQRSHALDIALDFLLRLVMTGFVGGVFAHFYPGGLAELTILSFNAIAALIYHPFALLSHSHVRLGYGPVLSRVLVSPLMHHVHHSMEPQHWDKNFGFSFSLWDRLFRTFYLPRTDEQFRLGLPANGERFDTVWALMIDPFVRSFRRLWPSHAAASSPR